MHKVDVTLTIAIANGPEIKETLSIPDVDAYGEIIFEIGKDEEKTVAVQPSSNEKLTFLLIKSEPYKDEATGNMFYCIGDTFDQSKQIQLDAPHLYLGRGGISRLGSDINTLSFKSTLELEENKKAKITILVGRKAIQPSS